MWEVTGFCPSRNEEVWVRTRATRGLQGKTHLWFTFCSTCKAFHQLLRFWNHFPKTKHSYCQLRGRTKGWINKKQRRWKNIFEGEGRAWPSFLFSQFPCSKPLGYITTIFRAGRKTSVRAIFLHFREGTDIQPHGWVTYHKSLVTKPDPGPRLPVLTHPCLNFPEPSNQQVLQGLISPSFPLPVLPQGRRPLRPKTKEEGRSVLC